MDNAFSLHLGVNRVDPAHYGSDAPLRGCENDARDMQSIARALGYQTEILLTEQATSANLFERLAAAAAALGPGDTFLLTLASHGSQVDDLLAEETDGMDETWCLYDRMVIDDEVYDAFMKFRPGVRVLVVADLCHSEDSVRKILQLQRKNRNVLGALGIEDDLGFRCIDPFIDREVLAKFQSVYAAIKRNVAVRELGRGGPDVVLLAACQDNQLAGDGVANGLFTQHLKQVWNGGGFAGDYEAFRRAISGSINSLSQVPAITSYGATVDAVLGTKPFSFGAGRNSSDLAGANGNVARCHLEFPAVDIVDRSRRDIQRYIGEEIAPVLVDACLEVALASASPRASRSLSGRGSWEIGCEKSTSGEGKCSVKIGGSF